MWNLPILRSWRRTMFDFLNASLRPACFVILVKNGSIRRNLIINTYKITNIFHSEQLRDMISPSFFRAKFFATSVHTSNLIRRCDAENHVLWRFLASDALKRLPLPRLKYKSLARSSLRCKSNCTMILVYTVHWNYDLFQRYSFTYYFGILCAVFS